MPDCFMCREDRDTRKVFMGRARGYESLCFDCVLKFFKIEREG